MDAIEFDIRCHHLSFWMTVCERYHITSRSFNHFIKFGRWGSAHIDSLSIPAIPTISSSKLFYVAPRARGTCDVSTVSSSAQDWNLQFIHDRLDGYVPNNIFSTTLAGIHRRQSFIFYASHAAEHNMTMEITTNEWTSSAAAISICNYIAPQEFSKFFPIFTTTLTSLTLHGGACVMVFQNMLLVGSYSAGVYETAYLDYFTAVTM